MCVPGKTSRSSPVRDSSHGPLEATGYSLPVSRVQIAKLLKGWCTISPKVYRYVTAAIEHAQMPRKNPTPLEGNLEAGFAGWQVGQLFFTAKRKREIFCPSKARWRQPHQVNKYSRIHTIQPTTVTCAVYTVSISI